MSKLKEVGKTSLQTYFKKAVTRAGGMVDHFKTPGRNGVPDFLVTWPMTGWAKLELVEIKVKDGAKSKLQELDHETRAKLNCYVQVLWSEHEIDNYVTMRHG
jgi:hypothetical protein